MTALVGLLGQHTELNWSESDILGFTALQQLTLWIEGLRLVLNRLGGSILQTHDRHSIQLLRCAVFQSRELCQQNPAERRCPESCSCDEAVGLLLEKGCRIIFNTELRDDLLTASVRCQETFISHLSKRRRQLRDMGLIHLDPEEIDQLGISKSEVVDVQTSAVIHKLERRNVKVPPELMTYAELSFLWTLISDIVYMTEFDDWWPISIYHVLVEATHDSRFSDVDEDGLLALAAGFYANGFEDVDSKAFTGITTLMIALKALHPNLGFCRWLMDHGADPFAQLPNRVPGYTVAHEMGRRRMPLLSWVPKGYPNSWDLFSRADSCRCSCSPDGCRPLTMFWKGGGSPSFYESLYHVSFLEEEHEFTPETQLIILRMATFDALNLRHTCCDHGLVDIEEDDREEIWDEDSAILGRLEDLVAEHQETLSRSHCSMSFFLQNQWKDRMQEVEQELQEYQGTSLEEERETMRQIGVNIEYGGFGDKHQDWALTITINEGEERNPLAYVTNRIDEVMSLVRAGQWPPDVEFRTWS